MLAGLSCAVLRGEAQPAKGQSFPSEMRRYVDAATETQVTRLTNPASSSYLTAPFDHAAIGRTSLLYSGDRSGRLEVYRIDFKSGQFRQLTSATALDRSSVTVLAGDRSFCFFDGPSLKQCGLSTLREREIYRVPEGAERGRGFSVSSDGVYGFFVEREQGRFRLRMVMLTGGPPAMLAESEDEISDPLPRPGHQSVFFTRGGASFLTGYDGRGTVRLELQGEVIAPRWSPDGAALLYLSAPKTTGQVNTLREYTPGPKGGSKDELIAKTSQFAGFGANGDATVFVGASGSKASPYVLLLLRSAKRELTLCEHRASDARMVSPIFAANSQRIVFGSDLHGKPAIYTMGVERFVEETES